MNKTELEKEIFRLTKKEERLQKDPAYSDMSFYDELEKKGFLIDGVYHLKSIMSDHRFDESKPAEDLAEKIDRSPYQMLFRLKKATRFQKEPMIHTGFLSIRYVYSGKILMETPRSKIRLKKNDLILMNSGFIHSQYLPDKEDIGFTLMFEKDYLMKHIINNQRENSIVGRFIYNYVLENNDPNNFVVFHGNDNPKLKNIMEDIIMEYILPSDMGEILLQAYLQILIVEMMRSEYTYETGIRSRSSMTIATILSDIDKNYADTSLEALADKYGYNADHISRQLKKATGMSFKDYLFEKKLEHAAQLLKNTDLSIREISERTGFSSETMFYRKFSEHFSVLPAEYRKSTEI
ncbi:MAG: helix-turn-helix domain-containing protein [Erysipelotrichaceae bacterium]|nr:helix-turn-helix domain-containing protein [Erysipelotrichaceae bacterium]